MALGPRALVAPGEIASLAAVPDTAIVLATRGRVPRRDIVRLRPEYPSRRTKSSTATEQISVTTTASAPAMASNFTPARS
jgi:hypothetical protein